MTQENAARKNAVGIDQEESPLKLVDYPVSNTPALDAAEEKINTLTLQYTSAGYAKHERGSLLRIFRKQFRRYVKFLMSKQGGALTLEDACKSASARHDEKGALELMEELLKRDFESVSFSELSHLWQCSPEEGEQYFELVKQEGQREFCAGHLVLQVFEPVVWFRTVWNRGQFLAIRDTFISEYEPEGGIEFALIDTLVMSFFLQNYWSKECVKRTMTAPCRESAEFQAWKYYQDEEAKKLRYDSGFWDIPYVSEDRAVRTATEMLEQFSRLFQRTLRQLNSHRLAKLKAEKLKAEVRRLQDRTYEIEEQTSSKT
jgi:hypothetical protein